MMSTYGATQSWVACHKRRRLQWTQYGPDVFTGDTTVIVWV